MQWTMPHRVLQIVAGLIGLAAVSSFALGIINAPDRSGRLPGAKTAGAGPAAAIEAADATPLNDERIEGPPPPSPEEIAKAKAEAEAKKAEQEAARARAEEEEELELAGNAAAPFVPRPTAPIGNATPAPPPNGTAPVEDPIF